MKVTVGSFVMTATFVAGLLVACGNPQRRMSVGADCDPADCNGIEPSTFDDASVADASIEASAAQCPSTACTLPFATCANSRFACDVDLRSDPTNCGACGSPCPVTGVEMHVTSRCAASTCTLECWPGFADCDSLPDNGCETWLTFDEKNCGACGNECSSGVPCLEGKCGCAPGLTICDGRCVDLVRAVSDCGQCGHDCGPNPPDWVDRPNSYFGCQAMACQRVCNEWYANCNLVDDDGCEVDLRLPDDKNCGKCDVVCPAGTKCREDRTDGKLRCSCPYPTIDCGHDNPNFTMCADITSDPTNCGGCGRFCVGNEQAPAICTNGVCSLMCPPGTADCNGVVEDGCEKNLGSDPNNCGACGNVCNGIAGQPCVDGRCAVEECGGPR